MVCLEYFRNDKGVVERIIERVFVTVPVHIGNQTIYEVQKLKTPRVLSERVLAYHELPEIFRRYEQ